MDDGIDTGQVIAQLHIPLTESADLSTLLILAFPAEADAFAQAAARDFTPVPSVRRDEKRNSTE
jgi:hypothetical protein